MTDPWLQGEGDLCRSEVAPRPDMAPQALVGPSQTRADNTAILQLGSHEAVQCLESSITTRIFSLRPRRNTPGTKRGATRPKMGT